MVPTRAEQRVLLARVGTHCIHTARTRPARLCQRCALIDVCRGVRDMRGSGPSVPRSHSWGAGPCWLATRPQGCGVGLFHNHCPSTCVLHSRSPPPEGTAGTGFLGVRQGSEIWSKSQCFSTHGLCSNSAVYITPNINHPQLTPTLPLVLPAPLLTILGRGLSFWGGPCQPLLAKLSR